MTQAEYKAVALLGAACLFSLLDDESVYAYDIKHLLDQVTDTLCLDDEPEFIEMGVSRES